MNESIKPNYGFEKISDNEGVTFSVRGLAMGFNKQFLSIVFWFVLMFLVVPLVMVGLENFFVGGRIYKVYNHFFIILVATAWILLGIVLIVRHNINAKKPQIAKVTKGKVSLLRGVVRSFDIGHISEMILGNDIDDKVSANSISSGSITTVATGNMQLMGAAGRQAITAQEAKRSWYIKIRYGSEYIIIFKRLNQGVAEALYLDFRKSIEEFQ